MGGLNLFNAKESSSKVSFITSIKKGRITARMNNVDYSVKNTLNEKVRIGETVLLNKSPQGFFIIGKTNNMRNFNREEVFING